MAATDSSSLKATTRLCPACCNRLPLLLHLPGLPLRIHEALLLGLQLELQHRHVAVLDQQCPPTEPLATMLWSALAFAALAEAQGLLGGLNHLRFGCSQITIER